MENILYQKCFDLGKGKSLQFLDYDVKNRRPNDACHFKNLEQTLL